MRNDLPRKRLKRECGILNLDGVSGRDTKFSMKTVLARFGFILAHCATVM